MLNYVYYIRIWINTSRKPIDLKLLSQNQMLHESEKVFKAMSKNDSKTSTFNGEKIINNNISKIKIIEIWNSEKVFKNIIDRINQYNQDYFYNCELIPIYKTIVGFEENSKNQQKIAMGSFRW
jgi:hypothetical protein